jgi:hypothetical protein
MGRPLEGPGPVAAIDPVQQEDNGNGLLITHRSRNVKGDVASTSKRGALDGDKSETARFQLRLRDLQSSKGERIR